MINNYLLKSQFIIFFSRKNIFLNFHRVIRRGDEGSAAAHADVTIADVIILVLLVCRVIVGLVYGEAERVVAEVVALGGRREGQILPFCLY